MSFLSDATAIKNKSTYINGFLDCSGDVLLRGGNLRLNGNLIVNSRNIALGFQAGNTNQGLNSIAIGAFSGNISQGAQSVSIGYLSAYNQTGINNTFVGQGSGGTYLAAGASNTFIGSATVNTGATVAGYNNTTLGAGATVSTSHGNSTAIGVGAIATTSNQIVLGTASQTVNIPGNLNFSTRPQTWYLASNSNNNATTAATKNIGGSTNNTPTSVYWNAITVFGGANISNWNTATAVFTASQSGLYQFQLSIFINSPSTTGRWLSAGGTCIPNGGSQYLSWGQSYISIEGSLSVSCSYYMAAGETFFWYAQNVTPTLFYAVGHTCSQIIKIY